MHSTATASTAVASSGHGSLSSPTQGLDQSGLLRLHAPDYFIHNEHNTSHANGHESDFLGSIQASIAGSSLFLEPRDSSSAGAAAAIAMDRSQSSRHLKALPPPPQSKYAARTQSQENPNQVKDHGRVRSRAASPSPSLAASSVLSSDEGASFHSALAAHVQPSS
ncbi:hypothetical protein BGW38_007654, partial [Lunasporangiospora selenospora]